MKHVKRELRYIRYRICRDIYYADQCPKDCRKNYNNIGKNMLNDSQTAAVKVNYEKLIECEKYVAATRARNELIITYLEDASK